MAGKVRIKFISQGFADVLRSDGTFSMIRGVSDGIGSKVRAKTRVHVFRASRDKRPMGAVWTDAKDEKEAYEARKQLKGAV